MLTSIYKVGDVTDGAEPDRSPVFEMVAEGPRPDDEISCKVCGEKFLRENLNDHRNTLKHMELQKSLHGETECKICKEKFITGYWKEHKKTRTHKFIASQLNENKKLVKAQSRLGEKLPIKKEKETYDLRQGSEENQQYINTLATFFALRYAFAYSGKDFKISINNKDWYAFGDVVIEVIDSNKTEITAIRCTKIETKSNYTTVALSAESGKLSLKEQCEILKKLRKNKNYENANFKLHTVSSVLIDSNPKFIYDGKTVSSWKEDGKKQWLGRQINIKQSKSCKKKDLFNTTDDADDVCVFELEKNGDKDLEKDLEKFQMYVNQKKKIDLEVLIKDMIEDRFNVTTNISEDLIKYFKKYFKTDKVKKNETSFKMIKEDVLLKLAELLLVPFRILPDHPVKEKEVHLWNSTIKEFDVVIMKTDSDIIEKIYRALTHIVNEETKYFVNTFNKVTIDKRNVKNDKLRSKIFEDYGNDGSLQFLYLALWKSGLIPLVLESENESHLTMILNVISFFKKENFSLKFIISTKFKPEVYTYLPQHLKIFSNLADVKFVNENLLGEILEEKIKILDFDVSLKDMDRCNGDFLEKLTPDALLNIFFKDYSFKDIVVPITSEIVDNTLVCENEFMTKIKEYFQKRESISETGLSYLVKVNGQPTQIQVPPQL